MPGREPSVVMSGSDSTRNTSVATLPGSVTIPQNTTTALVPVTGVSGGSTQIRVAASNVTQATANVTVQSSGAIGLPANVTLGPGQSQAFAVVLPAAAPSTVIVNLVSSDTTKVTIAPASVTIAAGQTQ